MSTFDGIVKEFPDIRIDYFRHSSEQTSPPLANFLSHVHSDHLLGLESCKAPFIYCSPATREILLRLEKYPHRMNFAKGILETRRQTYRHLRKLLKPIPLEVPTVIELAPGNSVRVTLFDANHCVGAVSFLIEGSGKAIFYTGDVRSEDWWVDSLKRHPLLIPYMTQDSGSAHKTLDCLYLDTTFATKDDPYKQFPSKAEGIQELLNKISKCPINTKFYFDSWTFGYEDVWLTLSTYLDCQVHVDDYRYGLYRSLASAPEPRAVEAARLMGFQFGNHYQAGCLTSKPTRLHSCERGTGCEIFQQAHVRITPIISRHNGVEMAELGAGGGHGDLNQQHELEIGDEIMVRQLMDLCASKLDRQPHLLKGVLDMLSSLIDERRQRLALDATALVANESAESENIDDLAGLDELPIERLVPALVSVVDRIKQNREITEADTAKRQHTAPMTKDAFSVKQITFPYSRHSSYSELCHIVAAFKPVDIHPCTVDSANWDLTMSMSYLFGHLYHKVPSFAHDQFMLSRLSRSKGVTIRTPMSDVFKRQRSSSPTAHVRRYGKSHVCHEPTRQEADLSGDVSETTGHCPLKRRQTDNREVPRSSSTDLEERRDNTDSDSVTMHCNKKLEASKISWATSKMKGHRKLGFNQSGQLDKVSRDGAPESGVQTTATSTKLAVPTSPAPSSTVGEVNSTSAFRLQAEAAALGRGGLAWNDIGLVSVSGHQGESQEL